MPRSIFVNLPVADVEKSAALYEAVGFARDLELSTAGEAASMEWSETIIFTLLSHKRFAQFAQKPRADCQASTAALFALSADSRDTVDELIASAAAAGGKADPLAVQDYGVMYGRSFEDLDGHVFEAMWMDEGAMRC